MAFYIIVRHRKDKQTWANDWVEGSTTLLKCIQTTVEVAKACEDAMRRGERIYSSIAVRSKPTRPKSARLWK